MSVKDTKEEALPIDSVRRAKVALIEDWGPVTNTIQHNTRYTIDRCSAVPQYRVEEQCKIGSRRATRPPLARVTARAPPPHSITVTAWIVESPRALYCASLVTTRVTLRYQRVRQGRRFGWWEVGIFRTLRPPPYDPLRRSGYIGAGASGPLGSDSDGLTADWIHTTQSPIQRCSSISRNTGGCSTSNPRAAKIINGRDVCNTDQRMNT